MNGLQATGAFVVQFRAGTDIEASRVEGGLRTGNFESGEEPLAVLDRVMKDVRSEAADPDSPRTR